MKLFRHGPPGQEQPGIVDPDGRRRSLAGVLPDIDGAALSAASLDRLRSLDARTLPPVPDHARFGPCVARVAKFVGIGLNYVDHALEAGLPIPREPVVFSKWTSCICGPDDDTLIPPGSTKTDWEVELGVVIGEAACRVRREDALRHVAGYCVVNDVSEREWQMERGPTWDKGKGFDTFGPIGPYLVTADEVPDPQALRLWLEVDGRRYQDGSTQQMIFGVAELVAYVSQLMTLLPGDVITTGTPKGVGMGIKPQPVYLRGGETVRLGIDGLGEQRQRVRRAE